MATTGADFSLLFDRKINKAYTANYNNAKRNRLFKNALINAVETKYEELDQQKEFDELSALIKTGATFTPSANILYLTTAASPNISDYQHLLAVKCKYTSYLALTLSGATKTNPLVITINEPNNLRTGEQIVVSGVVGNTNANGTFYIKKVGKQKAELYSDAKLLIPIFGNGVYISGGTVGRVHYQYAKPYRSDNKISIYGKPTVDNPRFEVANNQLKLYPTDSTCEQITMDYLSKATVFIDVTNTSTDLELTYPFKFLMYILDIATRMFAEEVKDKEMFDFSNFENAANN